MTDALTGDGAPRCDAVRLGIACVLAAGHVSPHEGPYMAGVTYGWPRDERCPAVRSSVACRLSLGHDGQHQGGMFGDMDDTTLAWS